MAGTKYETSAKAATPSAELDPGSPAISQRDLASAVVIFIFVASAALITAHGWSNTAQDVAQLLEHLPRPLQALLGESRLAHLLHLFQ